MRRAVVTLPALALLNVLFGTQAAQSATPTVEQAAAEVNQSLENELPLADTESSVPRCDDATFLRRATLDLLGRQPTAAEVTAFVLDPADDKRAKLVQRLLASEDFGRNWARYWRDVIMYRRSDPRAQIAVRSLELFLVTELNAGTPWSEIARQMITATGDVQQAGATGLIMAQEGKAEETAAEVSRIFLGIQIQCAQCHDHPTDRWKREQFHQLAAFFPRMSLRPVVDGERRSFEVVSINRGGFRGGPVGRGGGSLEHYMSNLEDPAARGTLMQPQFFVTDSKLKTGADDLERREQLAAWITTGSNSWFSNAFVNRVWSELVGEGFVEPVDDLGPDRTSETPKTFDLLANQFAASGYDVKWLYATVMATDAYQRDSRDRRTPDEAPFAANCRHRLRGDQLYTALAGALGLTDPVVPQNVRNPFGGGPRDAFNQTFGFDPSLPKDDVVSAIPQALFLMNSPTLAPSINASGRTALSQVLREISDDEEAVVELYLRCLAREPKESELKICLDHLREVGNRNEAFEDLLWSLINTTEFLHRK